MMDRLEREERDLEEQHENGEIDSQEYNRQLNELHRDYRAWREEEAQRAYDDEMNR